MERVMISRSLQFRRSLRPGCSGNIFRHALHLVWQSVIENDRNIYNLHSKSLEGSFLWAARTEAASAAKDVLFLVQKDVLVAEEALNEDNMKKIATARAVLI